MLYVTHDQVEAMTLGQRVAVLNAGRLQQVASPRELYERPQSAFVAGFIGNPPMNLLPGHVVAAANGGVAVRVAGATLPLARPVTLVAGDGAVTVGIRPEALALAGEGAREALRLTVEHVEWLGHETLVHLRAGSDGPDASRVVARLPGMHTLASGQAVALAVDPTRLHLFAHDDGRALV
jgi:ABC-type sugar transport system ATPase subunit